MSRDVKQMWRKSNELTGSDPARAVKLGFKKLGF